MWKLDYDYYKINFEGPFKEDNIFFVNYLTFKHF